MARLQVLLAFALFATSWAAPQFSQDDQPNTAYNFEYGVNVEDTNDVKEHKESKSESGRVEGEYSWLQPNGLFLVVRYYVDDDSGFVAEVTEEEAGSRAPVEARYRNSLSGDDSLTNTVASAQQSFAKSIDVAPVNVGAAANIISAPRPSINRQQATFSPRPQQNNFRNTFNNNNNQVQQQTFNRNTSNRQQQQQQQTFTSNNFNSQQSFSGDNIIDGGIIDGGIIDGGIIDGGIIDGGFINDDFDDSREDLTRGNRFQG